MTPAPFSRSEPDDLTSIDLIPDPVIGVDAYRRINLWNRAAERTYGFTRAEAIGQRPPELLLTRFPIPLLEILETVQDAGHWWGDVVHRAKDGRELTVESRWTVRYDERGDVSGGLQIDREITDLAGARSPWEVCEARDEATRQRVQSAHRQQDPNLTKTTGEFVHEFNNVLTVILNYADVIAGQLAAIELASPDPRWASMRQDLGEVQLAAARAARLIRQLVGAWSPDSGGGGR